MLPVRIDSVGLSAHQPPSNYPASRDSQRTKKQLQSAPPTYRNRRQPHQDNWFKSYFIEWIFIITIAPSPATTNDQSSTGRRGLCNGIRLCFLSLPARFQLSRFYISASSQRQMLCYTIINRFEATEKKKMGDQLNVCWMENWSALFWDFRFSFFCLAHSLLISEWLQIEHSRSCCCTSASRCAFSSSSEANRVVVGWFRSIVIAIMNFLSFILHRQLQEISFFESDAWINAILLSVHLQFIHLGESLPCQSNLVFSLHFFQCFTTRKRRTIL